MNKIARLVFWGAAVLVCVTCTSQDYEILWEYEIGSNLAARCLAIGHDGTIYYAEQINEASIVALNPDGSFKWQCHEAAAGYASTPSIGADGTIYFSTNEGYLFAVDTDGSLKWQQETGKGDYGSSRLAIASDGTIYVGASDGNLYAFDSDGNQMWTYERVFTPVIGSDGTLYCGRSFPPHEIPHDYSDTLIALNPDGALKWEYEVQGKITAPMSIGSDGTLYFGVTPDYYDAPIEKSYLYALGTDAVLQWKYTFQDEMVWISPIIDNEGTLYTGTAESLYAITSNGSLKWKCKIEVDKDFSLQSIHPIIAADGTIYFGSISRYLYAVDPEGTSKHEYKMEKGITEVHFPTIASDGTLYFQVLVDGSSYYLYAISSESYGLASSPWPKFGHDNQNTSRAEGL